jgi:hypothetical protein
VDIQYTCQNKLKCIHPDRKTRKERHISGRCEDGGIIEIDHNEIRLEVSLVKAVTTLLIP